MISSDGTQFYSFNETLFFLFKKTLTDLNNEIYLQLHLHNTFFLFSLREGGRRVSRVKLLLKITLLLLSFLILLTL